MLLPPEVFRHFEGLSVGDIGISSITGAELSHGIAKSGSIRNQRALEKFLAPPDVIAFDAAAMNHYGLLRALLERNGAPLGPLDALIAAHALALRCTLVTNTLREFERIPGLALENWAA